ncbi:MAG TPA: hypothetical protein VFY99_11410 [Solirubrobacterales bacterium]
MLTAWLVLPALLAGLALGVGLLAEAASGRRAPGALLVPLGVAGLIVAGQATASFDPTAELTIPLALALAAAGYALAIRRRRPLRPSLPPLLAFLVVAAVFGAPVIASGDPTFAGYIRLDDTSTWLALTDRVMEHGRSLDGLARSSYEAALDFNLADGYPIGVFVPLGIGGALAGTDEAWLVQPYMSVLAGALALVLYALLGRLVADPWPRALAATVAAQPALLLGYAQWGGIKEIAAAMLLALAAAAAVRLARGRGRRRPAATLRAAVPLALAAAATLAVLSAGGAVWLLPPLALALAVAWRRAGAGEAFRRALAAAALVVLFALPAIVTGAVLPPTSSPLTSDTAQGNLFEPLGAVRLAGIWPAGDFRAGPVDETIANSLIVVALAAALAGLALAAWRRARPPLVYAAGTLVAVAVILLLGSPWVDAKAMATAAPAVLMLALAAAIGLAARGGIVRRALGAAALAAIVAGVAWSNALAYRDASLAPYDQLAELERVGELTAGEGPALMTEYQPYGVRHFLRDADPEGVSELRRRLIPLRNGEGVEKGVNADTDELSPHALFVYRTLVLRRSPAQSRPPAPYELVWKGRYYEVWQRPEDGGTGVDGRLELGDGLDPTEALSCAALARLLAGERRGEVTAARRPGTVVVPLDTAERPIGWPAGERVVHPASDGTVSARFSLPRPGDWRAWLGGSVRGEVELSVDGRELGAARHLLNNYGFFIDLGEAELGAGPHELELRFTRADLHPGSGGRPEPAGPVILTTTEPEDAELVTVPAGRARELCGERLDWVEVAPAVP